MSFMGLVLLQVAIAASPVVERATQADPDRIYGRVTTSSGEVWEGYIRWDRDQATWLATLRGASKEVPDRNRLQAAELGGVHYRDCEGGLKISWGRVRWGKGCQGSSTAQAPIRFGHLQSLSVLGRRSAMVTLRSGEQIELRGNYSSRRKITVHSPGEAAREIELRDLERVDFFLAKRSAPADMPSRLFGTVITRDGAEFLGYVTWDLDEMFSTDTLDGDARGLGRQRIAFEQIRSIAADGRRAALVTLTSGEQYTLRGTNDVNNENRGILVNDPGIGRVVIEWGDFEEVRFQPPPERPMYELFDGGRRIRGTVHTEEGEQFTGFIRWDNDEEFTWEVLDGQSDDSDFEIEFGLIRSIEKESNRRALVTVIDGRQFELSDSNDVNSENRGIIVTTDAGEMVLVDWADFSRAELGR